MAKRASSRKNIKVKDEDCWIDHISRLPGDLLVCILSWLSLKEAAASSILSRRWRYVWTFISKLDFDGSDLCTTFKSKPDFDNPVSKEAAAVREYIMWVNDVMRLRYKQPAPVDELRISFSLNGTHQKYIDAWITFALVKKVVRLDLNLVHNFFRGCTFPYNLLCGNEYYSCGFKDLRLIRMNYVTMSDAGLHIFLRSCPLLEEVFLANCDEISTVKIVTQLPALKRLTLFRCFRLKSVEVRDSNLVYFMYRGSTLNHFLLENVPMLVEMNVEGLVTSKMEKFLSMFSSYLPQLERLTIEKWKELSFKESKLICSSVIMSNLKQLVWKFVGVDYYKSNVLMPLRLFIDALPLLQRLVLNTCDDRERAIVLSRVTPQTRKLKSLVSYGRLKEVEFVGYHGVASEFKILAHILENAAALEEVIIHPAKGADNQNNDPFRVRAKEQLTTRLRSTATLKIL